jgi:ABC-2 type transport system permease protein
MIAALVVVYLYNFKALPLDRSPLPTVYISNLIAFANIGLAGFIAASLATRFVYPCIGSERGAFYLIGSSPLSLSRFLFYKYCFYWVPFSLLTCILTAVSNHLLQIDGAMHWISFAAGLVITSTVLGIGLGFGSIFADFKAENKTAALGPGAIFFLFSAILYQIAVLGTGLLPTYRLVRSSLAGSPDISSLLLVFAWLGGAALSSLLLVLLLCKAGLKRLQA